PLHQHHAQVTSDDDKDTPPPRKLKSKHPISLDDDADELEIAAQPKQPRSDPHVPLPPKFNKPRYSTSDHGEAPTSTQPARRATDSDGEEHRPRLSKPQHPASASVHYNDEDQPPCPKPKPKPKPRRPAACDEHGDSLSAHVTKQSLNVVQQSQPASPPQRPSPPLSDLTDNDINFSPQAPMAPGPVPSKKRGRKKITDPDAPRRTSV
ncbi:uncharacterized protein HD556DRAFT_1361847, partial [Suillus plorans]